jgi:hypothetical protein
VDICTVLLGNRHTSKPAGGEGGGNYPPPSLAVFVFLARISPPLQSDGLCFTGFLKICAVTNLLFILYLTAQNPRVLTVALQRESHPKYTIQNTGRNDVVREKNCVTNPQDKTKTDQKT